MRVRRVLQFHGDSKQPRRAVVTLELILGLPILIIFVFAVIEFGLIFATIDQVAYASRFGAKLASEQAGAFDVDALRTEIDQYLQTAGLQTGACRAILQHNVTMGMGMRGASPQSSPPGMGGCDCTAPTDNLPTTTGTSFVRVTVCVPLKDNVPDLLCGFGFSLEDCVIEQTTTFRYELPCVSSPSPGGG